MNTYRYIDFVLMILSIFLITSCERTSNENQELTVPDVQYLKANFMGTCFLGFYDKGYKEVIIKDEQSFQNLGDSVRISIYNLDCSSAVPTDIDFDKYFLVGKFTNGGGCSVSYDRKIIADEENKRLVYKIDAVYSGICQVLFVNMNWALIPTKYRDYSIEFQVK